MEKARFLALICLVMLIFAYGCGSPSSNSKAEKIKVTIEGADGNVFESYEEACHAQDFEAAHKYITALKKAGSSDYKEAREFVFNQEALYLIAMNDEASTKRLFFLLQEDANEVDNSVRDTRCNTIVELAIKQNNQALVEQTIGMYNGKIDVPVLRKIYKYIYKEGRNQDKKSVMDLLFKNDGIIIMVDDAISTQDEELLMQIISKCNSRNIDASKKIIKYFTVKKDKKQIARLNAILRKNMQWEALMELGLLTNDVALMKQAYQKAENKSELFGILVKHAADNKSVAEMQSILPLVTNADYAETVVKKCIEIDMPNIVTTLTKKYGSQFGESFLDDILEYAITKQGLVLQSILPVVTNSSTAETVIRKCMKADVPKVVTTLTKKYGTQFSESFLDNIMDYAISKNGTEFTNLVISILNSTPISGRPLPAGQRMTSNRPADVVESHNTYVSSVTSFNAKCDEVLSSAISQHKTQLANKVVTLYKAVPNEYIVNKHWYQIAKTCTYSQDDKKRAQERVKEAKRRGDI